MAFPLHPTEVILGLILILSALGTILAKRPVHSCLSFLLTLLGLATVYIQLSAQFIGVMQILIYAGAILVIFMFVMVLFQDAHDQIAKLKARSKKWLLAFGGLSFLAAAILFASLLEIGISTPLLQQSLTEGFGTVQSLGKLLYLDFFFPFEAILLLFLIASIGAFYIGKKEL